MADDHAVGSEINCASVSDNVADRDIRESARNIALQVLQSPLNGALDSLSQREADYLSHLFGLDDSSPGSPERVKEYVQGATPDTRDLGAGFAWVKRRLEGLARLLDLDRVAVNILALVLIIRSDEYLSRAARLIRVERRKKFAHYCSGLFDAPVAQVMETLDFGSTLRVCELLTRNSNCGQTLADFYSVPDSLDRDLFCKKPLEDLVLSDAIRPCPQHSAALGPDAFSHATIDYQIIQRLLAFSASARSRSCHVLVVGPPGVGKTEVARSISHTANLPLYEINCSDRDGSPRQGRARFGSYALASKLLARQDKAVILFDEAEDVFFGEHWDHSSNRDMRTKAWINGLLEDARVPTIWISNSSHTIDPAYLRRFDYVLSLETPPRSIRKMMVERSLGTFGVSSDLQNALANSAQLTPADIARTARVVSVLGGAGIDVDDAVRKIVSCRPGGVEFAEIKAGSGRMTMPYRQEWISADVDVALLLERMRRESAIVLGFSGPPGTGKTEFARHIAKTLDKPLYLRKASDILDKWVGGTERNIAAAFREAARDNAILLLDEADSFLRDRMKAERPHEISKVNELLAQLDSQTGTVILATNFIESLDRAVIRRLDVKISFEYLKSAALIETFEVAMHTLLGAKVEIENEIRRRLAKLDQVSFGDVVAATRSQRWTTTQVTPKDLLEAILRELSHKQDGVGRPIGFMVGCAAS